MSDPRDNMVKKYFDERIRDKKKLGDLVGSLSKACLAYDDSHRAPHIFRGLISIIVKSSNEWYYFLASGRPRDEETKNDVLNRLLDIIYDEGTKSLKNQGMAEDD